MARILVVDNYDSFVYNLVQYLAQLGAKVDVRRNDEVTVEDARNYDGILSATTYAGSSVQKFQIEGQYCLGARDATWATLYTLLAEVEAGTRPVPGSFADVAPDLPVLAWPN